MSFYVRSESMLAAYPRAAARSPWASPIRRMDPRLSVRFLAKAATEANRLPGPLAFAIRNWRRNKCALRRRTPIRLRVIKPRGRTAFQQLIVTGFLRGQPINLGTPLHSSFAQSKPVAPFHSHHTRWVMAWKAFGFVALFSSLQVDQSGLAT